MTTPHGSPVDPREGRGAGWPAAQETPSGIKRKKALRCMARHALSAKSASRVPCCVATPDLRVRKNGSRMASTAIISRPTQCVCVCVVGSGCWWWVVGGGWCFAVEFLALLLSFRSLMFFLHVCARLSFFNFACTLSTKEILSFHDFIWLHLVLVRPSFDFPSACHTSGMLIPVSDTLRVHWQVLYLFSSAVCTQSFANH